MKTLINRPLTSDEDLDKILIFNPNLFDDRLGLDHLFVAGDYRFYDGRVFIDATGEYFHKA